MARKKVPLSLDRHRAIGAELHKMTEALTNLTVELSNSYVFSHRSVRKCEQVKWKTIELRGILDSLLASETTDAEWVKEKLTGVYM